MSSKRKKCKSCGRIDYLHKWKGFLGCKTCVDKWDKDWKSGKTPIMTFIASGRKKEEGVL